MEARNKLNEARYFLDNLKTLNKTSNEFIFNLSAFLTAWRSIIDVILYDYIEKYFEFSREEYFDARDFEIAARALGNQAALLFLKWLRKQIEILKKNPLSIKRNISVHRGRPPVKIHLFMQAGTVWASGALVATVSGPASPRIMTSMEVPWQPELKIEPSTGGTAEVCFADFPTKDIIDVCEEGFQQMKNMIDEAEKKFGNL